MVGRFPDEMSALTLIWATLEQDRLKWRGVRMDDDIRVMIDEAGKGVNAQALDLSALDVYLEAA